MNAENGTLATGSTGNQTFNMSGSFTPKVLLLKVGQKFNVSDTANHFSDGSFDGTTSECISGFTDSTGSQSKEYADRCVSHWVRVSGTLTEKIKVIGVSFGAGSFTLNFVTADANYNIHWIALG